MSSSFCGSGSSNLEPPDHGNSRRILFFAAAVSLRGWQMMALSKAHNLLYQFTCSAADRTDDNAFEMAALSAPLNLHQDSMAPARPKQRLR